MDARTRKRRVATSNFVIITLFLYYFYVTGNDLSNAGFRIDGTQFETRLHVIIKEVREEWDRDGIYFNHRPLYR